MDRAVRVYAETVTTAIRKIELPTPGIGKLRSDALADGYDFMEALFEDWATGANRFDAAGEVLLGCFDGDVLVAVGGLNIDPFANDPTVGRVRRVYVRPAWRNRGIGRALVATLVELARGHFRRVRLRAENADAGRLYERMGFSPTTEPDATHVMYLVDGSSPRPTGA
jgi:GNAT superfamily N-acetyltransferase